MQTDSCQVTPGSRLSKLVSPTTFHMGLHQSNFIPDVSFGEVCHVLQLIVSVARAFPLFRLCTLARSSVLKKHDLNTEFFRGPVVLWILVDIIMILRLRALYHNKKSGKHKPIQNDMEPKLLRFPSVLYTLIFSWFGKLRRLSPYHPIQCQFQLLLVYAEPLRAGFDSEANIKFRWSSPSRSTAFASPGQFQPLRPSLQFLDVW